MGGEGSMLGMIIALRNNANMRLKRENNLKKGGGLDVKGEFVPMEKRKKLTPEQLVQIRKKVKIEHRKDIMISLIALIISIGILTAIAYYLFMYL